MSDADPHDLQRFVDAQAPVWRDVVAELDAGAKTSHWMWFVFPQLAALGRSATARRYGLAGVDDARAYADHALLGPRLAGAATRVLRALATRDVERVFGGVDALKLRSSMTLFEQAAPHAGPWGAVLDAAHAGARDGATLALLARSPPSLRPRPA